MLNNEVQTVVESEIRELLTESGDKVVEMTPEAELVELGLSSLMLARLVIQLEIAFGTDPFADELAVISDMRSVGDLVNAYERALADAPQGIR